jgi:hypothetical protein
VNWLRSLIARLDLSGRLEGIGRLVETWWLRSALWVVAAVIVAGVATVMFMFLQQRNYRPTLALVAAVKGPSGIASIQYAVIDGYPFVRVRYPPNTGRVVVSDLWSSPDLKDWYSSTPHPDETPRFFGNTAIDSLFENIYLLVRGWIEDRTAEADYDAGLPRAEHPFVKEVPHVGQPNTPFCRLGRLSAKRFDFDELISGRVHSFRDNHDASEHLRNRNGTASHLYAFEPASELGGSNWRDLWCLLRIPATAQSVTERWLEIVNGIDEMTSGALPLKVEPPLIEPEMGGQARDINFVTENVSPDEATAGTLPPGGALLLNWTDGGSGSYRDFLLLAIGAVYGLAVALCLEALRPLFERRYRHNRKLAAKPRR